MAGLGAQVIGLAALPHRLEHKKRHTRVASHPRRSRRGPKKLDDSKKKNYLSAPSHRSREYCPEKSAPKIRRYLLRHRWKFSCGAYVWDAGVVLESGHERFLGDIEEVLKLHKYTMDNSEYQIDTCATSRAIYPRRYHLRFKFSCCTNGLHAGISPQGPVWRAAGKQALHKLNFMNPSNRLECS